MLISISVKGWIYDIQHARLAAIGWSRFLFWDFVYIIKNTSEIAWLISIQLFSFPFTPYHLISLLLHSYHLTSLFFCTFYFTSHPLPHFTWFHITSIHFSSLLFYFILFYKTYEVQKLYLLINHLYQGKRKRKNQTQNPNRNKRRSKGK